MKTILLPIAIAAALALAIAGCGGGDDSGATPTPSGTADDECSTNLDYSLGEVKWLGLFPAEILEKDEWRVLRGESDSPYVSVSRNREVVGAITLTQTELESTFLPAEGIDALDAWVDETYADVESDLLAKYGDGFELTTSAPEATRLGTLCAVTYGYVGTNNGEETDRVAGYASFDRGSLYLITAEYEVGLEGEAGFQDAATLADFQPLFDDFIASLSMPPGSSATEVPTATPDDAAPTQ